MAIELEAQERTKFGRGASRRLRRAEQVPAIITGKGESAVSIILDGKKLFNASQKAEFFEGLTLKYGGKSIKVKPVEVQRHPVNEQILHVDFLRL